VNVYTDIIYIGNMSQTTHPPPLHLHRKGHKRERRKRKAKERTCGIRVRYCKEIIGELILD
jgi:hypothetical protein